MLTSRRLEKDDWFETLDRVNWFNETVVEPDPGINQKEFFQFACSRTIDDVEAKLTVR